MTKYRVVVQQVIMAQTDGSLKEIRRLLKDNIPHVSVGECGIYFSTIKSEDKIKVISITKKRK